MSVRAPDSLVSGGDSLSFQLELFEQTDERGLEVRGRWFGIRGRSFVRPTLTFQVDGARQRLLADMADKPWPVREGEEWFAVFAPLPVDGKVAEIQLMVGPDIVVPLSAPSARAAAGPVIGGSRRPATAAGPATKTGGAAIAPKERSARGPHANGTVPAPPLVQAVATDRPGGSDASPSPVLELRRAAVDTEADRGRLQRALSEAEAERDRAVRELTAARERAAELTHKLKRAHANFEALRAEARTRIEAERAEVMRLRQTAGPNQSAAAERDRLAEQLAEMTAERDRLASQASRASQAVRAAAVSEAHTAAADPARIARMLSARPASRAYRTQHSGSRWGIRALAITPLCAGVLVVGHILHFV